MSIGERLKTYFLRGLAILLPTMLTIWIIIWGYKFIRDNVSIFINKAIFYIIRYFESGISQEESKSLYDFWVSGAGSLAGFVLALIVVCIVGAVLASVVGKSLWKMAERLILRAPLLKQVYPYVKQITDFLFTGDEKKEFFSKVVAIEYPRKGLWALGFVTGKAINGVGKGTGKEFAAVLVPTSPTPFTGFVIMIPKEELVELDITIEDALRFVMSCGVIAPYLNRLED